MKKPARNPKLKLFCALFAALILLGVAIWFAFFRHSSTSPATTSSSSGKVLMILTYTGGLCPDGNVCSTEYKLFDDGTFEGHAKLSQQELYRFGEAIDKTDLTTYKANSHPACPSAYDGQDEVLAFPQRYPGQSFTTCMLEIPSNDVAITFIHNLIETHQLH